MNLCQVWLIKVNQIHSSWIHLQSWIGEREQIHWATNGRLDASACSCKLLHTSHTERELSGAKEVKNSPQREDIIWPRLHHIPVLQHGYLLFSTIGTHPPHKGSKGPPSFPDPAPSLHTASYYSGLLGNWQRCHHRKIHHSESPTQCSYHSRLPSYQYSC